MSEEFRIIHLSDLHFVQNLRTEGTSFGRGRFLTNSHKYRFYTHLIDSLEATIGSHAPADVCLATGDISTDGSSASLATALTVFGLQKTAAGSEIERIETFHLQDYFQHKLIVPGNHDRFKAWRPIQLRSSQLERTFGAPLSYPYLRAAKTADPLPDVVFFVFDSTQNPDLLGGRLRFRPDLRIARGLILPGDWQWLHRCMADIAARRPIPNIDGRGQVIVNPDNCVRIVALHHHPLTRDVNDMDSSQMTCENGVDFADNCQRAGVHLILFGHRHTYFPRRVPAHRQPTQFGVAQPLHLVCAPTALEYKNPKPGYLIYRIAKGLIKIERYEWKEAAFDSRWGVTLGQGFHLVESPDVIPI